MSLIVGDVNSPMGDSDDDEWMPASMLGTPWSEGEADEYFADMEESPLFASTIDEVGSLTHTDEVEPYHA